MPFSTACSTPLSNFESGQNYKDVDDPAGRYAAPHIKHKSTNFLFPIPSHSCILQYVLFVSSVIVNFPLEEDPSVAFVAWTTTPWTLPSNLSLCVHPELTYVKLKGVKLL